MPSLVKTQNSTIAILSHRLDAVFPSAAVPSSAVDPAAVLSGKADRLEKAVENLAKSLSVTVQALIENRSQQLQRQRESFEATLLAVEASLSARLDDFN